MLKKKKQPYSNEIYKHRKEPPALILQAFWFICNLSHNLSFA